LGIKLIPLLLCLILLAPAETVRPAESPAARMAPALNRGVNLGNALEAPQEGSWGVTLEEKDFTLIEKTGFRSIRVPVRWSAHAETNPPYTIHREFFDRVDWVLDQARRRGLSVVLNTHHWEDFHKNPTTHAPRLEAIWAQIAARYQNRPDSLVFEIFNEPHDMPAEIWNPIQLGVLQKIRKISPERVVILSSLEWSSVKGLPELQIPKKDAAVLATFHYYAPYPFTHQGAHWAKDSGRWLGTRWRDEKSEREAIQKDFQTAADWSKQHGIPVYLGEFGAFEKAPMEDRVLWTRRVARTAEGLGLPWCYWEFRSHFGVYHSNKNEWRLPLLQALLPGANPAP
jgi:endoglucanase